MCNGSNEDQCIGVEIVHVFVNGSSDPSRVELHGEPGSIQEYELLGNSEFNQYYTETDIGAILEKF